MFKKISYVFIILFSIMIFSSYVYADCSDEEYKKYKEEADKIKVTYKHLEKNYSLGFDSDQIFNVFLRNVPNNFYATMYDDRVKLQVLQSISTITIENVSNGLIKVKVYANECQKELRKIEIKVPRFNSYSTDPLCEGVDIEKFPLCGKYYDYEVSREDFEKRVNHYRQLYIKENTIIKSKTLLSKIVSFITSNILYFSIGIGSIFIIVIVYIIIHKRTKRRVLK